MKIACTEILTTGKKRVKELTSIALVFAGIICLTTRANSPIGAVKRECLSNHENGG